MLEQLLDDGVEPGSVLPQQTSGLRVAVVADPADLVVDDVQHAVGDPGHPCVPVLGQHGDRPDAVGHPPPSGHLPGDRGAGL